MRKSRKVLCDPMRKNESLLIFRAEYTKNQHENLFFYRQNFHAFLFSFW